VSHTISLVWSINGRPYGTTSAIVAPNSVNDVAQHFQPPVGFTAAFTTAGTGTAKIYWDSSNPNNPTSPRDDGALAETVIFIIQ
jgi:hypothetical protein